MVRVQVQLDQAQHRQVKRRAKQLGVSVAEIVRRSLAAVLTSGADDDRARKARALAAAGRHVDPHGAHDVSAAHDSALVDAYRR